jgi:hypothetical protein
MRAFLFSGTTWLDRRLDWSLLVFRKINPLARYNSPFLADAVRKRTGKLTNERFNIQFTVALAGVNAVPCDSNEELCLLRARVFDFTPA